MSESNPEAIKKQVKAYIGVLIALCFFTVFTVGVTYFHLPTALALAIGLAIALTKGSMVGLIFMHLNHEKRFIYASLSLTAFLFFVCLLVPVMTDKSSTRMDEHMYHTPTPAPEASNGH